MKRSRPTRRGPLLAVVVLLATASCTSGGSTTPTTPTPRTTVTTTPVTTAPVTTAPVTTAPVTTAPVTTVTPAPVTTATTGPPSTGRAVVGAPPGRLPYRDASGPIAGLLASGQRFGSTMELETETVVRLRAALTDEGRDARVSLGSAADATGRPFQPAGSTFAFVLEIRNGELSGDDSSSGYDLVVYAAQDAAGWFAAGAAAQQLCTRGVTPDGPPLCI